MRKPVALVLFSLIVLSIPLAAAEACGDKFLVSSRGEGGFGSFASLAPSSILIYSVDSNDFDQATFTPKLVEVLEKIGHRVHIAGTVAGAVAQMSEGIDLVLTSAEHASELKNSLVAGSYRPILLPMVEKPEGNELARLRERFGHAFELPAEPGDLFMKIDEIVLMEEDPSAAS